MKTNKPEERKCEVDCPYQSETCEFCHPSPLPVEGWEKEFDEKFMMKDVSERAYTLVNSPNIIQDTSEIKDFIHSLLSSQRQLLVTQAKELHRKYMMGEIRQDIKDCKDKECDHYTLGADDYFHDLLVLQSNNLEE